MVELVGRSLELAALHQMTARAAEGRGGAVLLSGEAGVGKTAMLEAVRRFSGASLSVSGRAAGPDETVLLGPWREIIAELHTQLGCSALPLPAPFGEAPAAASPLELAMAVGHWLGSAGQPLLVAGEDLQWADAASLDLFRHLVPRLQRLPVLLIGTYRSDELGSQDPLWRILPDLQRAGASHMPLERLREEAVAELVAAMLPAAPGLSGLARSIHQRTDGHPLFVRELLAWYVRTGVALADENPLPETVQQVLEQKLSRLSPGARSVLHVAAVIGERFEFDLLQAAVEGPMPELLGRLEEAVSLRLLRVDPDGETFAFDHALLREVLLSGLLGPRRRMVHGRVATALLGRPGADPDHLALHLDRAGDPRAPQCLLAAGDRSFRVGSAADARKRYERALALAAQDAPYRAEALLKLGYTLPPAETDRARLLWTEAAAAAGRAGDNPAAVWSRHALALQQHHAGAPAGLAFMTAVQEEQEALLGDPRYQALEAVLYGQSCGYPRIASSRALALAKAGRLDEGRALLEQLYARALPSARRYDLLYVEYWMASLYGTLADALEIGARVVDEALRLGDARTALRVEGNRLYQILLCKADQPEKVDDVARSVAELLVRASEQSGYDLAAEGFPPLGWYHFLRGNWEAADAHLLEYLRRHPENEDPAVRGFAVQLYTARGDLAGAQAVLTGIPPQRPDEPPALHSVQVAAYGVRAELALAGGQIELARQWLEAGDRLMAERGQPGFRAALQMGWAKWHRAAGDLEKGRQAAAEALALAEARREFRFMIRANLLLGEICADLGRPEAVKYLEDALNMATACRFPYYASRALDALSRQQGAAVAPGGLTERELDVVRLVAAGLADKEVAARLHISPRTVDAHLRNIFNKLDITNRTALAAFATRQGLLY